MNGRSSHAPRRTGVRRRYLPLFTRIVVANILVLGAAAGLFAVLSPRRVSELAADEVLIATLCLVTLVTVVLVRRIVLPLQQLTSLARELNPVASPARFPGADVASEAGELALTFNEMLDRLDRERAEAARNVLSAHEAERTRVAQELHDEVGQTLTAVLLQLSRLQGRLGDGPRVELSEAQEAVRATLEDVRRIATELRPETLTDLGLASALANLGDTFARRTGIEVRRQIDSKHPPLTGETELAIYRVAQEALTNVARHADASCAELALDTAGGNVTLVVRDYGRGLPNGGRPGGNGIRGMRERADAIGATLSVGPAREGPGSEVRLGIPVVEARP